MSGTAPSPDALSELARTRLGVRYLYPIQRFVISNTLEGRPQIVVLPTGSGKSLCFQLPSLVLPGATLVLLPLLSLMSDQLRKLEAAGVAAGALRGGLSPAEKERLFTAVRSGAIRILLATPEACLAEPNLTALRGAGFSHIVIDEAHCVSEWGDTFRPAYREIGRLADRLGIAMRTAFTATASPSVIARIRGLIFDEGEVRVVAGDPDRPNISYRVTPTLCVEREIERLVREEQRPALVFFRTRGGTELAARSMRRRTGDRRIFFYHAGLSREERAEVERWFLSSRDGVLFATCAYGLGVDKPDIRTVAHAQVPSTVEAYLQETGRAGRDGLPSRAVLFASREDRLFPGRLDEGIARERYEGMLGYALSRGACRRHLLLSLIGQEPSACAGCDVCDGSAREGPGAAREIMTFFSRNQRKFSAAQAAMILTGAGGPRAARDFHDCTRGWGGLAGWHREDAEKAIAALVAEGALAVSRRGPWKNRVSVTRGPNERRAPS